jgi:hypothetical protein
MCWRFRLSVITLCCILFIVASPVLKRRFNRVNVFHSCFETDKKPTVALQHFETCFEARKKRIEIPFGTFHCNYDFDAFCVVVRRIRLYA